MPTRMTHPLHGATHAYGTGDIERHKALGWRVEEVSPVKTVLIGIAAPDAVMTAVMTEPEAVEPPADEKRKGGRPRKGG